MALGLLQATSLPFIVAATLMVIGAGIWGFWLDPEKSVVNAVAPEALGKAVPAE